MPCLSVILSCLKPSKQNDRSRAVHLCVSFLLFVCRVCLSFCLVSNQVSNTTVPRLCFFVYPFCYLCVVFVCHSVLSQTSKQNDRSKAVHLCVSFLLFVCRVCLSFCLVSNQVSNTTVPRLCFFVYPFLLFVCRVCLSFCLVCSLQPCSHLLGKGLPSWLFCM